MTMANRFDICMYVFIYNILISFYIYIFLYIPVQSLPIFAVLLANCVYYSCSSLMRHLAALTRGLLYGTAHTPIQTQTHTHTLSHTHTHTHAACVQNQVILCICGSLIIETMARKSKLFVVLSRTSFLSNPPPTPLGGYTT